MAGGAESGIACGITCTGAVGGFIGGVLILNYLVLPAFESIKGMSHQNAQLATAGIGIFGEMEAAIGGGILAAMAVAAVVGCCAGAVYCCGSAVDSARNARENITQLEMTDVDTIRNLESGSNAITVDPNYA